MVVIRTTLVLRDPQMMHKNLAPIRHNRLTNTEDGNPRNNHYTIGRTTHQSHKKLL